MFICMSSGARERYRKDIIRALAMPKGTHLQFRYQKKWVSTHVQKQIAEGHCRGQSALIAYVDQDDHDRPPQLVPCRFASIVESSYHGSTASVEFRLEGFAYSANLEDFNKEVGTLSSDTLPTWTNTGEIAGSYWVEVTEQPSTVREYDTPDLNVWEKIVSELAGRADFEHERCFYHITGLYPVGRKKPVAAIDGQFPLASGTHYDLSVYHYHPGDIQEEVRLKPVPNTEYVEFVTNPILHIDSRYDLKKSRLLVRCPDGKRQVVLSMLRSTSGDKGEYGWDFDLPLQVRSSIWKKIVLAIFIGLFLATPHIISVWAKDDAKVETAIPLTVLHSVMGLLAALAVVFCLRKNL